jgi:hypothetical protein
LSGYWLPATPDPKFIPSTCKSLLYDTKTTTKCLKNTQVVFIGDSQIRQLYESLASRLLNSNKNKYNEVYKTNSTPPHTDLETRIDGSAITLLFFWDPYLNRTYSLSKPSEPTKTSFIIAGGGLWNLRHLSLEIGSSLFRESFTFLLKQFRYQFASTDTPIYIRKVPAIHESLLSESRKSTLTNEHKGPYDALVYEIVDTFLESFSGNGSSKTESNLRFQTYGAYLASDSPTRSTDGIHLQRYVNDAEIDILLNEVCNGVMYGKKGLGGGGGQGNAAATCCLRYPRWINTKQVLIFSMILIFGPGAMFSRFFFRTLFCVFLILTAIRIK